MPSCRSATGGSRSWRRRRTARDPSTRPTSPARRPFFSGTKRTGSPGRRGAWRTGRSASRSAGRPSRSTSPPPPRSSCSRRLAMIEGADWWGEHGPVVVEVRLGPPHRVVAAKEGSTLDPAEASTVFLARAPGTGGGTKVGLYVAKRLAEAHGGELAVSV